MHLNLMGFFGINFVDPIFSIGLQFALLVASALLVFLLILICMSWIEGFFQTFIGYRSGSSSSMSDDMITRLINNQILRNIFTALMIVAVILLFMSTMIRIVRSELNFEKEGNAKKEIYKKALLSLVYFVVVPATSILGIYLASLFLGAIYKILIAGVGEVQFSLDNYSQWLGGGEEAMQQVAGYTNDILTGKTLPLTSMMWEIYGEFMTNGWVIAASVATLGTFPIFFAILIFMPIIKILFSAIIGTIQRIYELAVLFLVSPPIVGVMPLDDGASFKNWKKEFYSRVVSMYGLVVSVNLMIILIGVMIGYDKGGSIFAADGVPADASLTKIIFKYCLILAGILSIRGMSKTLSGIIGGRDALESGSELTKAMMAETKGAYGAAAGAKGFGMKQWQNAKETMERRKKWNKGQDAQRQQNVSDALQKAGMDKDLADAVASGKMNLTQAKEKAGKNFNEAEDILKNAKTTSAKLEKAYNKAEKEAKDAETKANANPDDKKLQEDAQKKRAAANQAKVDFNNAKTAEEKAQQTRNDARNSIAMMDDKATQDLIDYNSNKKNITSAWSWSLNNRNRRRGLDKATKTLDKAAAGIRKTTSQKLAEEAMAATTITSMDGAAMTNIANLTKTIDDAQKEISSLNSEIATINDNIAGQKDVHANQKKLKQKQEQLQAAQNKEAQARSGITAAISTAVSSAEAFGFDAKTAESLGTALKSCNNVIDLQTAHSTWLNGAKNKVTKGTYSTIQKQAVDAIKSAELTDDQKTSLIEQIDVGGAYDFGKLQKAHQFITAARYQNKKDGKGIDVTSKGVDDAVNKFFTAAGNSTMGASLDTEFKGLGSASSTMMKDIEDSGKQKTAFARDLTEQAKLDHYKKVLPTIEQQIAAIPALANFKGDLKTASGQMQLGRLIQGMQGEEVKALQQTILDSASYLSTIENAESEYNSYMNASNGHAKFFLKAGRARAQDRAELRFLSIVDKQLSQRTVYKKDDDGNYLLDSKGNYIIEESAYTQSIGLEDAKNKAYRQEFVELKAGQRNMEDSYVKFINAKQAYEKGKGGDKAASLRQKLTAAETSLDFSAMELHERAERVKFAAPGLFSIRPGHAVAHFQRLAGSFIKMPIYTMGGGQIFEDISKFKKPIEDLDYNSVTKNLEYKMRQKRLDKTSLGTALDQDWEYSKAGSNRLFEQMGERDRNKELVKQNKILVGYMKDLHNKFMTKTEEDAVLDNISKSKGHK